MPGFDNNVMYADNVDFRGVQPVVPQVTTNGQLLIGSTATPNIRVNTLTPGSGVTITNGPGTITIGLTGGGSAVEHLTGNTGGQLNPDGSNNFNITGTGSLTVAGSGSTLTPQLTGLTNHALQVGAGTATLTQLGAGTTGQVLQTNTTADPTWSTATYPSTTTAGRLLVSTSTNVVGEVTGGTTGQLLVGSTGSAPSFQTSVMGYYGDGSDGLITFDGTTTVLGLVPAASVYTLTFDIFLGSSTINNGVTIITKGYRIFCNGTLTNNGTIKWNGNDGTALGVAGGVVNNGSSTINFAIVGTAGGAGNVGAGGFGGSGVGYTFGGVGGGGGNGSGSGGNGGLSTARNAGQGSVRSLPNAVLGASFVAGGGGGVIATWNSVGGGTGGGGGSGDGVVKGGGGGSGGGLVILSVYLFAGTGNIQAIGGNGGSPTTGTNCGGGGGGGGGLIIIISRSILSGAISGQTISVAGGSLGTGFGTGTNGNNGNIGTTILLPN